ncbi:MAG: PaaI family thioesterase [Rhodobacteraceae bacterium]|nr:PaaI family thioesterase [Paracoccaceae bacterium]
MTKSEPMQLVEQRRDAALAALMQGVPYIQFLGIKFDRHGDELTGVLRFENKLIGNPFLPALHGGVTSAFLEVTSIISLSLLHLWGRIETGEIDPEKMPHEQLPSLPKTIDFTVDYLRSGRAQNAYARATVARAGRRFASVQSTAWQDNQDKPFAQASGHFLMPQAPEAVNDG